MFGQATQATLDSCMGALKAALKKAGLQSTGSPVEVDRGTWTAVALLTTPGTADRLRPPAKIAERLASCNAARAALAKKSKAELTAFAKRQTSVLAAMPSPPPKTTAPERVVKREIPAGLLVGAGLGLAAAVTGLFVAFSSPT